MLTVNSNILDSIFWAGAGLFLLLTILARVSKWFRYALPSIPTLIILAFAVTGNWDGLRDFINALFVPQRFLIFVAMLLVLALVFYQQWTRPRLALPLLIIFLLAYIAATFDPQFFKIACKPDNIPISLTIFSIAFFVWLALRRAAINDSRIERGEPLAEGTNDDQVMVWPDLVHIELLIIVICTAAIIAWSVLLRAPLEAPADPALAPNPAKAPWYFLGLQELLVYFDPWIAGIMLPLLIIAGLCALPYLDKNPRGNGYYTLKERPFAISVFLSGFIVLWIVPIVIGIFFRGPNWNFYGPFEYWDPHKATVSANLNLSDIFWMHMIGKPLPTQDLCAYWLQPFIRETPGLIGLLACFLVLPWILKLTLLKNIHARIGGIRYVIMSVLLTCMALVPIKILLRWIFEIKYIVAIPEWSLNI